MSAMRTKLTFSVDGKTMQRDAALDLISQPVAMLTENFFLHPLAIVVGGNSVYEGRTSLLHLATMGLATLERVKKARSLRIPHDSDIHFERIGTELIVRGPNGEGRAPYGEVHTAWREFSRDVAGFLTKSHADLRSHPRLSKWLNNVLPAGG